MSARETRPRHARQVADAALSSFRAVVINGPRQAGKTTLARELARTHAAMLVSLDDSSLYDACRADPGSRQSHDAAT
ncbi:MAG: AAA family ATPase [Acidimicrobiales bacterium]